MTIPLVNLKRMHDELHEEIRWAIDAVIGRGDFILGQEVSAFEEEFAAYCEADHCITTGSGLDALSLIMRGLGIGRGDEVITTANTFIATALAIHHAGATPVFIDHDPETYNLDPKRLSAAITPRTRAIIPVHLYGHPADMDAIQTIAATLDLEHFAHPFTQAEGPIGVIAVTSETGLLGGLNNQVITTALQEYGQNPGGLIIVGRRGATYVQGQGLSCQAFPGIKDTGRRRLASEVRDYAFRQVSSSQLGALTIVYPRALSFTVQRVEVVQAVPCQSWLLGEASRRAPIGGRILLESPRAKLLEYLVWLWLGEKLFEVFGMSRLAELSARSVHLDGSTQELQRRGKKLQRQYFRQRHELIDSSMRELFAARSLYGKS